ncbi:MAG: hypothetical protein IPJ41_18535 [Phycisphaerales bacterium]|nr:hypothetical protein [Phycisphaerales bacterium]
MSSVRPEPIEQPAFDPLGGVLAVLFPGAGHWYQGEVQRALIIAGGVLGLFVGGLLIGGIDVVDSRQDRLWFLGEVMVGPVALGVDYYHQHALKGRDPNTGQVRGALPNEIRDPNGVLLPAPPGSLPPMTKSLGKMNEIGTLYCTMAGFLNLIVIIDAAFPSPRRKGKA